MGKQGAAAQARQRCADAGERPAKTLGDLGRGRPGRARAIGEQEAQHRPVERADDRARVVRILAVEQGIEGVDERL